jgi:hypothetical protein
MAAGEHRRPFRTRRFDYDEVETILAAAEQLDELYALAEGRLDSDLANSMGSDLRELVERDKREAGA